VLNIDFSSCRTGKAYFYNPVTKDSSWTRPSPKPPPPPPLPKPKTETTTAVVKTATGLIPGTKDPEDVGKWNGIKWKMGQKLWGDCTNSMYRRYRPPPQLNHLGCEETLSWNNFHGRICIDQQVL